jgi:hypothetical protein
MIIIIETKDADVNDSNLATVSSDSIIGIKNIYQVILKMLREKPLS